MRACINIESSDVHFDGAEHTVDGTNNESVESIGVAVGTEGGNQTLTNVTLKQVTASDRTFGIGYLNVSEAVIEDSTACLNSFSGIEVFEFKQTVILDNTITDTTGTTPFPVPVTPAGIILTSSSNNDIVENSVTGVNGSGFVLKNSSNENALLDNTANENANDGFTVNGSENVALILNTANDNGDDGVEVTGSNQVALLLNELTGNGDQAVEINDSENVLQLNSLEDLKALLSEDHSFRETPNRSVNEK